MYGKKSLMLLPFSDRKNLFIKVKRFVLMIPKWKSGNGIIQTGNGIIYHFFSHWMKKLIFTKVLPFDPTIPNWFSETGKGMI